MKKLELISSLTPIGHYMSMLFACMNYLLFLLVLGWMLRMIKFQFQSSFHELFLYLCDDLFMILSHHIFIYN
jgi:hypothetical protein